MKSVFLGFLLAVVSIPLPVGAESWHRLPGVAHVHSSFSSGQHGVDQLVDMARSKGLEVLVLTDHDLVAMEYGVQPLRNLLRRREERDSVLRAGPETYLEAIKRINASQSDVIVVPGVQSSPFYYWNGSPLDGSLTAYNYRKELLLIGMTEPEHYQRLPVLHGELSTRYTPSLLPRFLVFVAGLFPAVFLWFKKGGYRLAGCIMGVFSLLLALNHHPFQSSRFDPYHGDQGIRPYQEVIDYVNQCGGLSFWSHPESRFSENGQKLGPLTLITRPYPQALMQARGYTGFAALYGDAVTAVEPGRHWDRVLTDYCRGVRGQPVWGMAESDFHHETGWLKLDTLQTVFLVKEKSMPAVLEAMRRGRMYAVLKTGPATLVLDRFQVLEQPTGKTAQSGETLAARGPVVVEGTVDTGDRRPVSVSVVIVKNGQPWQSLESRTPMAFHFVDSDPSGETVYYRLLVNGKDSGRIVSNPIIVRSVGTDP